MEDRTVYETDHRANVAKLTELANVAQELVEESETFASRNYWLGMRDGLLRARGVIEGRG